MKKIKLCVSTLLLVMCFFYVQAQPGISELNSADKTIRSWFPAFSNLSLVLAGCFGILGGVRIFQDWQQGDKNISKAVTRWGLAAFFMAAVGGAMRALFL